MSTDKTLADVQPGGRVRLGDGPTIEKRARELLAAEHRKCDRNTEADLVLAGDVTALGQIALNAIIAALSAQPSPGATALGLPIVVDPTVPPDTFEVRQPSPGETLPPEMRLGSPDYLDYLDTEPSPGGQGDAPFAFSDRAKANALEAGQYAFTEADGEDLGYTACIEACVDAICRVLEMPKHLPAIAARQPVGEPVVIAHRVHYLDGVTGKEIAVSPWMDGDGSEFNVIYAAENPTTRWIENAYDAPVPAQAVDLVPIIAGLHEIADFDVGTDSTTGEGHCDAIYKARELLDLIDSQAVSK